MNIIFKIIVLTVSLFVVNGCVSYSSWSRINSTETPWCAANVQAEVYTRRVSYFMAPKFNTQVAWVNPKSFWGLKTQRHTIEKEISDFFYENQKIIESWPKDNSLQSSRQYNMSPPRRCPFLLFLVSIDPTVVIGLDVKTRTQLTGHSDSFDYIFPSFISYPSIKVSQKLPLASKGWWINPASSRKLEPIDLDKNLFVIDLNSDGKLYIIKKKDCLEVIRK